MEVTEATELFRAAVRTAIQVLGQDNLQTARVIKEVAQHLEDRHTERGRPENSRWNRCHAIDPDEVSKEA